MLKRIAEIMKDEEGASMVEYALLVALIAVVGLVTLGPLGTKIAAKFAAADTAMP